MKQGPPPQRRGRLRKLSAEELELWLAVTREVLPQPGAGAPAPATSAPDRSAPDEAQQASPPHVARPRPPLQNLGMLDRRLRQKLSRGRTPVDAVIDLHGMRQQEAHAALQGFLQRAQRNGAKVVLVVTGKGEARGEFMLEGAGILRRSVPHWLNAPDWRSLVGGFEEASRQHGGAGALYVRLRRLDRAKGER
jgi:DNA-nicking Smr family endonuclease